jgi:hypothetical protein
VAPFGLRDVSAGGHTKRFSFGSDIIEGSGVTSTETRDVSPFKKIESGIGADIFVTIGEPQRVSVSIDDNLISFVTTEVRRNTLLISADKSFSTRIPCKVEITVPSLESVVCDGSGEIEVATLNEQRFDVDFNGSGSFLASGKVEYLTVDLSGSGEIDVRDLSATNASVEISGSGDVELTATNELDARIDGSGDIVYHGGPEHVQKDVSGSGNIRRARD